MKDLHELALEEQERDEERRDRKSGAGVPDVSRC
jgi:hypothetical protein